MSRNHLTYSMDIPVSLLNWPFIRHKSDYLPNPGASGQAGIV